MSAYDNPTIIKDDSAMTWAQATSGFAESFKQSFDVAKKEREAKEKEAKLDAEKKAKESEQLLINIQRTNAEIQNTNAIDLNRTVGELPKTLAPTLTSQFGDKVKKFGEKFGEADVKNQTTVVGEDVKSVLAKKPIYLKTRQNVISTFGAVTDNVNTYDENFQGDGSDVSINGLTPIERMANFYTMKGLNPKNAMSSKTTKNLDWDEEDPSKARLLVSTKFNSKEELKQALGKWAIGKTSEELDGMITGAGKDITDNGDGSYSLNFEKPVGDGSWDGAFYTKLPPVLSGEEFKNAQIVDEKNNFSTKYLLNTTNIAAKGYDSKKPGVKGYWQGTEIDMKNVENDLRPVVQARMEGLLNADFRDPNVFQGFLTNKLKLGVNDISLILNAETYEKKVALLTNQAMKIEVAKKFGNSLHEIKTKDGIKYYFGDKDKIQDIDQNPKKLEGGGDTTNQQERNAFARNVIANGGVFPGRGGLSMVVDKATGKVTVKKVDSAGLALTTMTGYENMTPMQIANSLGATLE
jgi:hypothetical protein